MCYCFISFEPSRTSIKIFPQDFIISNCQNYIEFGLIKCLHLTYSGKNEIESELAKVFLAELRMQTCISCAIPKNDSLKLMRKP